MNKKIIDFRSDTVTHPTEQMRQAMAKAIVGDDMMQEDPTVNQLEELAAEVTGKQASLLVPSGVFGNQLAFYTHCNRGDEIIISNDSHPVQHEAGAVSIISGANMRIYTNPKQWFSWEEIEQFIRFEQDLHYPRTALIHVQNTLSNGDIWPIEEMKKIYINAQKNNIKVHLDGARIFNAAIALNVEVQQITQYADSVMFCLSKALAAPIGSMLCGKKEFIEQARKKRKIMGGAMRQAGIIAAAGIIAIQQMSKRLTEDHINAKKLAIEFAKYPQYFEIELEKVKTNMVFVKLKKENKKQLQEILKQYNILTYPREQGMYRFVTHYQITQQDIEYFISLFPKIIEQLK